jgi:hypothetical protein
MPLNPEVEAIFEMELKGTREIVDPFSVTKMESVRRGWEERKKEKWVGFQKNKKINLKLSIKRALLTKWHRPWRQPKVCRPKSSFNYRYECLLVLSTW